MINMTEVDNIKCKYCGSKAIWIDGIEIDYECGASECDGEYYECCKILHTVINNNFEELIKFEKE